LRCAVSARRAVSLSHNLARCVHNHAQEGQQVRFLPVAGDRHVWRDEIHHDAELRSDRGLGDGMREPAAEGVDVTLVVDGLDRARHGRAVDADHQSCARALALARPHFDHERDLSQRRDRAERGDPRRHGIRAVWIGIWSDRAEPFRLHRAGIVPRPLQQHCCLVAGNLLADGTRQPRDSNDLARLCAGATV
jgi:hypothetical protein